MLLSKVFDQMAEAERRGKNRFIILLVEGAQWHASQLTRLINEADNPYDAWFTILGYVQRGGPPPRFDRIWATRMGFAAVEALLAKESGMLVSWRHNRIETVPGGKLPPKRDPWDEMLEQVHRVTTN